MTSDARAINQLQRVLGIGFGVAVTVGNTVGAGILRTPGEIAARLPARGLITAVWLVGGVYSLLAANGLAELGAMLPREGAVAYTRHAIGTYAGFIVGSDRLGRAVRERRRTNDRGRRVPYIPCPGAGVAGGSLWPS